MLVYSNVEKDIEVYSMDITRWGDFETLFGEKGACGGCWCMAWRLDRSDFKRQKGDGNKKAMRALVEDGNPVGVIGYANGKPIGWCAAAPRIEYKRLENSRVWKRIDSEPVWSVTCFYIAKPFRNMGISLEMLKGAINYCRVNNARIIEGYPIIPYSDRIPDAFAWTGIPSIFKKSGFTEVERRSKSKPIMRYYLR